MLEDAAKNLIMLNYKKKTAKFMLEDAEKKGIISPGIHYVKKKINKKIDF